MILRFFNASFTFLKEVRMELKKTSFPSRQLTIKNTIIVIVFSLVVALFLGGLDMLFSYLLNTYVFAL